ncbi:hypothetical protein ACMD2_15283 [Ananas comosus]|uniref:Uncharacterized protein n=1 Tax=Ananas comosus TaxID=4615 RepID=A0A199UKF0_ANACO|nr:hypothetical protein ACMD2_15283 [Ananas comosus]
MSSSYLLQARKRASEEAVRCSTLELTHLVRRRNNFSNNKPQSGLSNPWFHIAVVAKRTRSSPVSGFLRKHLSSSNSLLPPTNQISQEGINAPPKHLLQFQILARKSDKP